MKVDRSNGPVDEGGSDPTEATASQAPTESGNPTPEQFSGQGEDVLEGTASGDGAPTAADSDPFSSMFPGGVDEVEGSFDPDAQTSTGDDAAASDEDDAQPDPDDEPTGQQDGDAPAEDETPGADGEDDVAGGGTGEVLDTVAEEAGVQADDPSELASEISQMKNELAGYQELQEIVRDQPGFQRMLSEMAQGKTVAEAAAALDGVTIEAPDPEESPEEYAEWKAAQRLKEQQAQEERSQRSERQQQVQQKQRRMQEEFEGVVERNDLSDEAAQEMGETIARLTATKADAQVRAKDFEVVRKGLRFDEAVEKAREEGREEGREEALQQVRDDGTVQPEDGLPDMRTAGGGGTESGSSQEEGGENVTALFGPTSADTQNIHGRM
jgi:hypothetical protein